MTSQKHLGLLDNGYEDVRDKIVKWLYDGIENSLQDWIGYNNKWTKNSIDIYQYLNKSFEEILQMDLPNKPDIKIIDKTIQFPIKKSKNTICGYADISVKFSAPKLYIESSSSSTIEFDNIYRANFVIFLDKFTLNSILRTIRTYQIHTTKSIWIVVSMGMPFNDIEMLQEQGIRHIEYANR